MMRSYDVAWMDIIQFRFTCESIRREIIRYYILELKGVRGPVAIHYLCVEVTTACIIILYIYSTVRWRVCLSMPKSIETRLWFGCKCLVRLFFCIVAAAGTVRTDMLSLIYGRPMRPFSSFFGRVPQTTLWRYMSDLYMFIHGQLR